MAISEDKGTMQIFCDCNDEFKPIITSNGERAYLLDEIDDSDICTICKLYLWYYPITSEATP